MTSSAIAKTLAPHGVLRAAINTANIVLAHKAPATGALSGVSVALAQEIARRLALPLQLVEFDSASKVSGSAEADIWDVAFLAIDPARVATIDFTGPYVTIEGTYLVPVHSGYLSVADLDRPGVRITAARNSAYALHLGRTLQHATLIEADTSDAGIALFNTIEADAAAGVRQPLQRYADTHPGVRVLPDAYTRIEQAVAIPKGRGTAADFLKGMVAELSSSGFVARHL